MVHNVNIEIDNYERVNNVDRAYSDNLGNGLGTSSFLESSQIKIVQIKFLLFDGTYNK